MLVLEEKLSILTQGPSRTRRNPALDVLTGRVPDERVRLLQANLQTARTAAEAGGSTAPSGPTATLVPVAAVRMAAVARSTRAAPSPWLKSIADSQPRLVLISPPMPWWTRIPWLGSYLLRFAPPIYGGVSSV